MNAWAALVAELDRWADRGRTATFWWRDDDAAQAVPALDRLLHLAETTPLALAVIPAAAEPALAERAAAAPETVTVVQHGYAHRNHAAAGARKCELGPERPAAAVLAELGRGLARLRALFGDRLRAVLVPPWNRIGGGVVAGLAELGFVGLSAYGPRPASAPPPVRVNTHVDLVDWRGTRGFVGDEAALALALRHLAGRREHALPAAEPTGLLTHHRIHDEDAWHFVARLHDAVAAHPAGRWLSVDRAFGLAS